MTTSKAGPGLELNSRFNTIYVERLFEKVTDSGSGKVTFKNYVRAGGMMVAMKARDSWGGDNTTYLHGDHLGSVSNYTDGAGSSMVAASYDAYGDRRGANWTGDPTAGELTTMNNLTRRGFTEHEMLDSTQLVHMNGRAFNPIVGRFVSADPMQDCGLGTQGWNRYAYVGNRTLSATDPTGFDICLWVEIPYFVTVSSLTFGFFGFDGFSLNEVQELYIGFSYQFLCFPDEPTVKPLPDGSGPCPAFDVRDGCGPSSLGFFDPFPDSFGFFDFHDACVKHDQCYRTCDQGANKEACDKNFRDDLDTVCTRIAQGIVSENIRNACTEIANSYFFFATTGTQSAFDNGIERCKKCRANGGTN